MTAPITHFSDLAGRKFQIPAYHNDSSIIGELVFERGTRSFARRLADAGYEYFGELNGMSVDELIIKVPTTRRNLDRCLHYICAFGRTLG